MNSDLNIFSVYAELGFSAWGLIILVLLAVSFSSYVKIATVLSVLRVGLGASSIMSVFVTGIVAISLSFLVMFPTLKKAASEAGAILHNEQHSEITDKLKFQAFVSSLEVWKEFMKMHSGTSELEKFNSVSQKLEAVSPKENQTSQSGNEKIVSQESLAVVAPAFIITELKRAFATGLALILPLLIIELLVAHLLVAVGITNISASFVALPFKLLLFVMLDGWTLITTNLLQSYL
jgi:type III secretion protein R